MANNFVPNTIIPDLGRGAGLFLLGFRAHARRGQCCCTLRRVFHMNFGDHGEPTLQWVKRFVSDLGWFGRRRISLGLPGTARLTPDELTIIAALTAMHRGQDEQAYAHLEWLFAGPPSPNVEIYIPDIVSVFSRYGAPFDVNIEAWSQGGDVAASSTYIIRNESTGQASEPVLH